MKELVEYIARSLVDYPEAVEVTESSGPGRRVVNLKVAPVDMGKVIGKQGRIAQAMRTLLKVAAARSGGNGPQPVLIIGTSEGETGPLADTVISEEDEEEAGSKAPLN